MYLAVRHFWFFIEGRPFTAFTDHEPLTFCMAKVSEPLFSHQARHLAYISEYTTDIRHVEGINNPVENALSRVFISAISSGVDYTEIARCQQQDYTKTLDYQTAVTGLRWEDIFIGNGNLTLLCNTSTGHVGPLVPASP